MDAEVINRLKKRELDDLLAKITERRNDLTKKIPLSFFNLEQLIFIPFRPLFKNRTWSNGNGTVKHGNNKIKFKGENLSSQEAFDLICFMSTACINFNITKLRFSIGTKNVKMRKPLSKEEINRAFDITEMRTVYELSNYLFNEGLEHFEEALGIECTFIREPVKLEDVLEPADFIHYMKLTKLFEIDITSKLEDRENSIIIDRYLSKHKGYTYRHLFPIFGNMYFRRIYKLETVPVKCIDLKVTFTYDLEEDYDRACLDLFDVKQYNIGDSEIIDRIPDFFEELKLHANEVTEDIDDQACEESLDSFCL